MRGVSGDARRSASWTRPRSAADGAREAASRSTRLLTGQLSRAAISLHLPSPFGDKDMIQKRMAYSGGFTGRMTTLLAQAAELAIRQKTEAISLALLDQAASAGIFKIPAEEETDDAVA